MKEKSCFTFSLNDVQKESLRYRLSQISSFEPYSVGYADFAFKKKNCNVVMYSSGKLVLQGKEAQEFVSFVLEPEILQEAILGNEEIFHPEMFQEHAGMDESGKGDFFGPITTACVIASPEAIRQFVQLGVKDSKKIASDRTILELAESIQKIPGTECQVFSLSMSKYNELYKRFGSNLNRLLGWMHSVTLKNALKRKFTARGLLDQFSKAPIVQNFIQKDFPEFFLEMRSKAEEDPVVAAASILARATYVKAMNELSTQAGMTLLKGASSKVVEQGKLLLQKVGEDQMSLFCKMHFKTLSDVLSQ